MLKNHSAIIIYIDINVLNLLSDRRQNRIQEFAVFANKSTESENKTILEMHCKMKQWWEKISKRELATDDFMHSVTFDIFNSIDSKKLRLK